MPGLSTHYVFGIYTYRNTTQKKIKTTIKLNLHSFALGLQGPDMFFDFLPLFLICRKNTGRILHTQNTGLFLRNLIHHINNLNSTKEKAIGCAYLYGFLGHYVLDCAAHPMIYSRAGSELGKHLALETEIDSLMLEHFLHKNPLDFKVRNSLALSDAEETVICRLLYASLKQTYPHLTIPQMGIRLVIKNTRLSTRFFVDRTGFKKTTLEYLEKLLAGAPFLSPRFITDSPLSINDPLNLQKKPWADPWDKNHTGRSFIELFEQASLHYNEILMALSRYLEYGDNYSRLLSLIGNKSYHTGLEL